MGDRAPINIPTGNSRITPDAKPFDPEDRLTGDKWTDYKKALAKVGKDDLQHIDQIPCIRQSLLYGIGGGVGLGAIRLFGSGRVRSAMNWAFGSFLAVSVFQWETCRRARAKELHTMRMIQDNFKHISTLEKKSQGADGKMPVDSGSGGR